MMAVKKQDLSPMVRLFVYEYMIDFNATQAAIRAGYSADTANRKGHTLRNDPRVSALIEKEIARREKKAQIDAQYVLDEIVRIQQANIQDIVDDNGNVKDVTQWPEVWQRMVNGIEVQEEWTKGKEPEYLGRVKKVKMMNREKILELLGKHVNVSAFAENHLHEHKGEVKHTHTERVSRLNALSQAAKSRAANGSKATH